MIVCGLMDLIGVRFQLVNISHYSLRITNWAVIFLPVRSSPGRMASGFKAAWVASTDTVTLTLPSKGESTI